MTIRLSIRAATYAVAAAAVIAVPVGVSTVGKSGHMVADCGGINMPIVAQGITVDTCPAPVAPPGLSGGAPSQELLSACSGIPGCLSNALYGPGNVLVPIPDTTVHQSQ